MTDYSFSFSFLESAVVLLSDSVGKLSFNSRIRIWSAAKAQPVSRSLNISRNKTTVIIHNFVAITSDHQCQQQSRACGSWQGCFASLAVLLRLGLTGAPVKRQIFNLCRAQSSFLACCSRYLFVVLCGNCWCLQNQIGVWSPPMSSDSWNTECMPLGDLYVLCVECVAVESNSGPLRHCWRRCCCRVEALAAFSNSIGFLGWIILNILH